jgi:hypothetical protein
MGGSFSRKDSIFLSFLLFAILTFILCLLGLVFLGRLMPALSGLLKTWAFCALFVLIPVISLMIAKDKSVIVTTLLFLVLFIAYKLLFKELPLAWVIFISIFFIFLAAGGGIVQELKKRSIDAYRGNAKIDMSGDCISALEDFFGLQQTAYYSIPAGFFLGVLGGVLFKLGSFAILLLSVKLSLLIAVLWMIYILYSSFQLTYHTFILPDGQDKDTVQIPFLSIVEDSGEKGVQTLSLKSIDDNRKKDIGIALTEVRKIYFYYNVLNGVTLSSLIYMLLSVSNIRPTNLQTILLFFLTTFLCSQLPYSLGQYKLHSTLLLTKEGVERKDLEEQLDKYLPLFPKFPLLISLSSGFAGGIVFQFAEEAFKGLTK